MHQSRNNPDFPRPEDVSRIMMAWEHFVQGGAPPTDALRCLIDDSWRRCLGANVDPSRLRGPTPVTHDKLADFKLRNQLLISASTEAMTMASDFLSETGTIMLLTDTSGLILESEGDLQALSSAEEILLTPGCSWDELVCGTNAIGTALSLGSPVQVHGSEHYCEGIKGWTCSATTIRDPFDGRVLGALDVSGRTKTFSRQTLALVVMTASRIEGRLAKIQMQNRFRLLESCVDRLSGSEPNGVIIVDCIGRIVKANEMAPIALGVRGIDFKLDSSARIPALCVDRDGQYSQSGLLPEWLSREWLQPVFDKGECLGTLITLKLPAKRGAFANQIAVLREAPVDVIGFSGIVGSHPLLMQAIQKAKQLARSNVPVLLLGETGSGKEGFARGIHELGTHAGGPFVTINCGCLSRDLLASELFGYGDGAFTGSRRGGMIGKVEAANGGTLFLDEIGEMPLDLQTYLLRVLEEGEICRLGETKSRKVDFRLVTATNRDLRGAISRGEFRMDLFYRIAVTSIRIAALRDRKSDIPLLVGYFLQKHATRHKLPILTASDEVLTAFNDYEWPGNVRELRNAVESMVLMSADSVLMKKDMPEELQLPANGACETAAGSVSLNAGSLDSSERESIKNAIRLHQGNLTAAAKYLGIAKSTIYQKIKKYHLCPTAETKLHGPAANY